jgi:hypothetical protein
MINQEAPGVLSQLTNSYLPTAIEGKGADAYAGETMHPVPKPAGGAPSLKKAPSTAAADLKKKYLKRL